MLRALLERLGPRAGIGLTTIAVIAVAVVLTYAGHAMWGSTVTPVDLFNAAFIPVMVIPVLVGSLYHALIELEHKERILYELATRDGLTGAYNRRHFTELADNELRRAVRRRQPVSVLMVDVDHFKQVNDTYGHQAGDDALKAIARLCQDSIRDVDVLGRYGGEEFIVFLPDTAQLDAMRVAERIRAAAAERELHTSGGSMSVTVSIGVASARQVERGMSLESLVRDADTALYTAKERGRDRVVPFERAA